MAKLKKENFQVTLSTTDKSEMPDLLDQEYTVTKIAILARVYQAVERFRKYSVILDTDDDVFAAARKNALLHEVLFKMITPGISPNPTMNILPLIINELLSARNELKHPELIKIANNKIKSLGL